MAATLIAASYGVVAATSQYATAGTDARLAKTAPVEEVAATDTATPLPGGSAGGLVIDEAHGQVFISRPNRDSVIVTDLDGQIVREITGFSYPTELAISADGGTVYVVNFHDTTIGQIDTTSYAVTPAALSEGTCPHSVAFSGGKAWYTYDLCDGNYTTGGVGVLDPATNTGSSVLDGRPGNMRALPDRPDRVVVLDDWGQIDVYDLSSDTPSAIATLPEGSGRELCRDAAFLDSGDTVVTACGSAPHHEVFHTADLSGAGSVASGENPNNVAVSPDGNVLAAGTVNAPDDIHVWNVQNGTPGTAVRSYELGSVDTNAVAFSAAGRLYAVESSGNDAATLHVLEDATKIATTVTVDVPKAVKYRGTVKATGTFDPAPGDSATSLAVTRRDRAGEHDLGTVPVAADGGFAFNDTPNTTGPVVYVVGYAGDETHAASGAKAAVTVRPLPFDINADGYAETVVGAYAEDIGSIRDAGGAIVFPGSSTGVKASGSKWYDQNTSGVPGAPETGDMFGFSNTSGDFNGDGYTDVAISVGAENIGSAIDGGIVQIFSGSASGLRTDNVKTLGVNDTFLGAGAEKVYFGDALAAGDFNGDGRDDLAIGAAGASQVFVSAGSDQGLSSTLTPFNEGTEGVPGTFHSDELFGYALSAGDINGDGRDDLAVGAKFDYDDKGWSTGSATVLYGSESGLTGTGAQRWSKEVTGVPGGAGSFNDNELSDEFGHQLVLADFNGDGKADLAVGAPGAPITVDGRRKADAGTLTVLYSNGVAIGTTNAVQVSQQTSGMPGISGAKDYLGATMAAGDANGDGRAELAAYSYGDTYVTVIPGAAGGLAFGSAKGWTQNSAGIPGSTETGDRWGNSLRFAYVKGAARAALLVGADGENSSSGAFTVIYSTSSGLTGTGSQIYTQNTTGVPGTSETGDRFGSFF